MPHLVPPDSVTTLAALLDYRAQQHPQQTAYTFLVDGETATLDLSYQALATQAGAIAAYLYDYCPVGGRVVLLFPPGLAYIAAFWGCICAGVVAVPAYPPRPNRSWERLQAILSDCQAVAVLTTHSLLTSLEQRRDDLPELQALHWLTLEDALQSAPLAILRSQSPDQLAFLQYTSGSTAAPKGVMISHRNVLHNLHTLHTYFEIATDSVGVFWLPLYHDMGLVGGVLQPLFSGRPAILMSPLIFIQRPVRWLAAISNFRATISGGPNFAYDLCVQKVTPEQQATLDLSHWSLAFNGAEPINPQTLTAFAAKFADCGFRWEAFYPCYGMAETTLLATGSRKAAAPITQTLDAEALARKHVQPVPSPVSPATPAPMTQTVVGCGTSPSDQHLLIVDPDTGSPCPPDRIGEIWIAGPSVAQGYWRQPAVTTFAAQLATVPGQPFLRTGDLGFIAEGNLFVTGRLKDVIVIHGRNYFPQDLEWTLEQHCDQVRSSSVAAFGVHTQGTDQVVILAEVERQAWRTLKVPEAGAAAIATMKRLIWQHHHLQVTDLLLLKPGTLPKTSSGKLQRHQCRQLYLAGAVPSDSPCGGLRGGLQRQN